MSHPSRSHTPARTRGGFFTNLDFNDECTHEFVRDVCKYWIETYGIDGIRLDYTLGFGLAPRGSPAHALFKAFGYPGGALAAGDEFDTARPLESDGTMEETVEAGNISERSGNHVSRLGRGGNISVRA